MIVDVRLLLVAHASVEAGRLEAVTRQQRDLTAFVLGVFLGNSQQPLTRRLSVRLPFAKCALVKSTFA